MEKHKNFNGKESIDSFPEKSILKICEARALLGDIPKTTMSDWIKKGLIKPIPGTRRITRAEIDRFIEEMSKPKTPEQRKRGRYNLGGTKKG